MAADSSSRLREFRAAMPTASKDLLGSIRHWSNLQLAIDDDTLWLKGFTETQTMDSEIRQLPGLMLYEMRDGLLFLKDALVPVKKMRTALLWSPIEKALRLSMPDFNHNYFGIQEKIKVRLVASEVEQDAVALLVNLKDIESIITSTPKFKLTLLQWTVLDDMALFLGTPLLSFPGQPYWQKNGHLLPSGRDFEFKNLSALLQQKCNAELENYLLWNHDGSYVSIPKSAFVELSLSSFRLTKNAL